MTGLRSYGDPCGIARALDVIGERWALPVVRELLYGPRRFSDLRASLRVSPNVLTQRLGELEESGVVQRRNAGGALYELTDWGHDLHPILLQLGRWGARTQHRPNAELSMNALMAALEACFVPDRAGALRATYELRLDQERFTADVEAGSLRITRGSPRGADATIETDGVTLRAVVFGDQKLGDAQVTLLGDARLGRTFFRLFKRP